MRPIGRGSFIEGRPMAEAAKTRIVDRETVLAARASLLQE
jgi:hypothetical protein